MHDLRDRALGKYIIMEEIGRGGMGAVYKARDVELDRVVAMKVLSPYLVGEPRLVQRFMREARLAANLDHPNIVTIYDIGGEGGYYYFVMKYLEGKSLKEILAERGALPPQTVIALVSQLAAALDYAHGQNLIHRDVKPGNVIVDEEGHATLTDFGLAKVAENLKLTASGETIGTLEYMAPEQARGDSFMTSDVYSLGVMLYEMLTGHLPFQGNNQATLLYQHLHEDPPPLSKFNSNLPPEFDPIVRKAMAKDPAERYQTAGEIAHDLEEVARKHLFPGPAARPATPRAAVTPVPGAAVTPPPVEAVPPQGGRPSFPALLQFLEPVLPFVRQWRWAFLSVAGVLVLVLGSLGVAGALRKQPTPTPAPPSPPTTTTRAVAQITPSPQPTTTPLPTETPSALVTLSQAQLALFCELKAEGTYEYGYLSLWSWGQNTAAHWPNLPKHPVTSQISWSPDGTWIAMILSEEGTPFLYRVQTEGNNWQRLFDSIEEKEDPAISPDGLQIAFADGPQGERGIFLVDAAGGKPRNVTPGESDDWAPSWSPDGRSIAFVSNRDGDTEIYRLDLVANEVRRLTNSPGHDVYPSWSPDGKSIVFISDRDGLYNLYIMSAAGQDVRLLLGDAVRLERPTWAPQSDWVALTRQIGAAEPQVLFISVTTGEVQPGPAGCRQPAWRPRP